jgi:hypothetical protein
VAVEAHFIGHIRTGELPGVVVLEPRIGRLELASQARSNERCGTHTRTRANAPAVGGDQLLEDAVPVPEAVPPQGQLLARARVEVARGETAEAAVAEPGVALLHDEVLEVEAELAHAVAVLLLEAEVEERVVERAAHEELEREVVCALWRLARVVQLRRVPVCLRAR